MATQADMDILDRELKEAQERARLESGEQSQEMKPAPDKKPDAEKPPEQIPNAELDALKQQLAAEQARVAELTAKLNADDGRRGGEIRTLREQLEQLRVKMLAMADENKKLLEAAAEPKPPEVPDANADEDAVFEAQFPTRAAREKAEAKRRETALAEAQRIAAEAKQKADALEAMTKQSLIQKFATEVAAEVPDFSTRLNDPAFNKWAEETMNEDAGMTWAAIYDAAAASLNSKRAIRVLKAHAQANKPTAPVVDATADKGPKKPTPEGQALPAPAAGGGDAAKPKPDASKDAAARAKRIKELEYKVLEARTATMPERAELEKLYRYEGEEQEKKPAA